MKCGKIDSLTEPTVPMAIHAGFWDTYSSLCYIGSQNLKPNINLKNFFLNMLASEYCLGPE